MGHRHTSPDFSVAVDGAFVAPALWLIHAEVRYRTHVGAEARARIRAEARIELLRGVITESRRAWDAGAESVHLVVDGDHAVAGHFQFLDRDSIPALVA